MGNLRNEACFCGSGKKQKKCHSDYHVESRAANLIRLYNELDAKIESHYENSLFPSYCKKGCSHCCYDAFSISQIEFDLILKELNKRLNKSQIEKLFENALNQVEQIKVEDPLYYEILETDGSKDQDAYFKQVNHADKMRRTPFPCVFLEDGMCSVYDIRPYVCRSFGNSHVTSPYSLKGYEVCEVIPGSKVLESQSPNIDEIDDARTHLTSIRVPKAKFVFQTRQYPIFYWFKVYYQKNGYKKEINIKDDMGNFSLSQKVSSINTINKFYPQDIAKPIIQHLED